MIVAQQGVINAFFKDRQCQCFIVDGETSNMKIAYHKACPYPYPQETDFDEIF